MRQIIAILLASSLASFAAGAEVVLRSNAVLSGSLVRFGDVAEILSDDALEAADLANVALLPAPAPGTQMFLTAAQLRDLLAANAVDVGSLQFRGAATVAILLPAVDAPKANEIQISETRPDRETVKDEIAVAIVQYLQQRTEHELWNVTVVPEPKLVDLYWHAGASVSISGGRAPWVGRQRFDIEGAGVEAGVKAFVTVERVELAVTAVRPIAMGDFVRATDVELRPYTGILSEQTATSLDQVIGKEAQHAIRADAVLLTNQIRSPLLVRRGERVTVRARAGQVVVRTYGTVQQDGSLGDLVQVQALEGRERYAARVSGVRELEVFAAGASAEEVAAAAR